MPELPDVETFKRYIDSTSLHKKIIDVNVKNTRILEGISQNKIKKTLQNNRFISTSRHGKYLFIETNQSGWLILHFGMTGYIKYFKNLKEEPSHTRFLLTLENGYHFAFHNQRLLGKIGFTDHREHYIKDKKLGIDALQITCETLKHLFEKRTAMIKSTLMNQHVIAGIGNIYADEILFQSRVHPTLKTNEISGNKVRDIYQNMKRVLEVAIDAQANSDDFPSTYIIPHRKKNGTCPIENESLETIKVNGRTTYFCPVHQKKK
jgi:formamidopyrimidine-DNA glycosylase